MDWLEVTVVTHTESVEAVSEIFMEIGAKGVSIEDPLDYDQLNQEQLEWLSVERKSLYETDEVFVKAYFQPNQWNDEMTETVTNRVQELKSFGLTIGKGIVTLQTVGEADWAEAWKKYYFPVRVTRYLTVVPSWLEYQQQQEDELLIRLDPGLAFGLAALEQYVRGGESVLDVGTGSGVLSIAAKLLGASKVTAFDIDEMATRVSKENISLNLEVGEIAVYENNLLQGIQQPSDLIVANILAEILLMMPVDAYRNLNENGVLILSGIIQSKAEEVRSAYENAGFTLKQQLTMGEWNTFVMTKVKD